MKKLFNYHNTRRARMLRKMAAMRAAKARRRRERPPPEVCALVAEKVLELGLRDLRSGEVAWVPFRSLRDAMRRLAMVQKYYVPGKPHASGWAGG